MASKKTPHKRPRWLRTCVFCDSSENLTKEHIFGDWLRKLGYDGSGTREIGNPPIAQIGGPFSKTLKIVCETCNNGWMSSLEATAKPLLIEMFETRAQKVTLKKEDQKALAHWAYKTAIIAVYADSSQDRDPFPQVHRRSFYENNTLPEQTQIWIGHASIPPINMKGEHLVDYVFEPSRTTWTSRGITKGFRSYRVTFRILNVVFDILGYVTNEVTLTGEPDEKLKFSVLPLWPPRHPHIWWPPVASLDTIGGVPGLTAAKPVGTTSLIKRA